MPRQEPTSDSPVLPITDGTIEIAEHELTNGEEPDNEESPGPLPDTIVAHLDKSHVTVHTYPVYHKFNFLLYAHI